VKRKGISRISNKPEIKTEQKANDLATAVENAIATIQAELDATSFKPSVADLVRLLQLRKELSDTQPTTVTARWIDEWNEKSDEI
jgi:hypothetical protein